MYKSTEQPASLVSEYGSKGSLRDLLEDNDTSKFNLTWEMKKCLMLDVANGLNGLHKSAIKYHGFLKSSNCIVDGRLTVKIADFGLVWAFCTSFINQLSESIQYWLQCANQNWTSAAPMTRATFTQRIITTRYCGCHLSDCGRRCRPCWTMWPIVRSFKSRIRRHLPKRSRV